MNTKNYLSQGLTTRSVLMFTSIALSSMALGFTLYTSGPMAKIFAATPSDRCIVTIFGVQYDLTALGTIHSGPQGTTLTGPAGFFQCGTDMTAIYQGQHGTNVSRLAPYIYTAPVTTTPTPTPVAGTGSPTPTPSISPTLGTTPTPVVSVSPTPTQTVEDHNDEPEDGKNESDEQKEEHSETDKLNEENNHVDNDSHVESRSIHDSGDLHNESKISDTDKKSTN